ncbi:MAG TPA: hypothetical protein HA263_09670 [Methanoregulaceae archaeon]|nr:hypothetical protein [Methanoregulaceae archaeon]
MPFKALCDGEPVICLDFPAQAWREEKTRRKTGGVSYFCPHCGEPMALATSQRGRPYFKHYPKNDCPNSTPKSSEHERLQVAIYQLCRELGRATDIEARGPGGEWTADVFAAKGEKKCAFEVQLAPISGEALEDRSRKYRASGIVPVWLLKKFPARSPFRVPARTFVTAWRRRTEPRLPESLHPLAISEDEIDLYFLDRETIPWSVSQTVIYWRELGAVLAEFDADDPDHQRVVLRGRPTTLVELVVGALDGEIHREFTASINYSYSEYYGLIEKEKVAQREHERLAREVRQQLGMLAWERVRTTVHEGKKR